MAGVTSEMLGNMMRSTLGGLKNFAEMLNAELAEEIEDAQNRASAKETFVNILNAFGDSEAVFEKGIKCLKDTERTVGNHIQMENIERIGHDVLKTEVFNIIKMVEGKEKTIDRENSSLVENIDESKIVQQLENVQDILNEYHPLKFHEDEEDDNSDEEERISQRLEQMQKKAMKKIEKRMSAVNENDEEFVNNLNENEDFSDSEDAELVDYENLERPIGYTSKNDNMTCKNFDVKLNQMWAEYQENLKAIEVMDVKKTYDDKFKAQNDVERCNLPFFSKFNESILDQFTGEAIFVLRKETNYVDPISKKDIVNPVRNKICDHVYDRDVIFSILRSKKEMACPLLGCSCKSFKLKDLEEDEELTATVSQSLAKKQTLSLSQQDTHNVETENLEDTLNDDDNNDISDDEDIRPSTSNTRSASLVSSQTLSLSHQETEPMETENQEVTLMDDDNDNDDDITASSNNAESQELF